MSADSFPNESFDTRDQTSSEKPARPVGELGQPAPNMPWESKYPLNLKSPIPGKEPVPRAYRADDGAWLGGVCAGLAEHLNVSVAFLRGVFVALSFFQFFGAVVYAAFWVFLPKQTTHVAPGLEAASRDGMRPEETKKSKVKDFGVITALALFGIGVLWLIQGTKLGISSKLFWPVLFAGVGIALIWKQADESQAVDDRDIKPKWLAPFLRSGGWTAAVRTVVGVGLIGASVAFIASSQIPADQLPAVLGMTLFALAGILIVSAPWIYRHRQELKQAQEEKILSDARADMAAHLHDSVLQTLALIQRQSHDSKQVAHLARTQERELRTWLYGEVENETFLKAAIAKACSEVESERGVPVDVICVGDTELNSDLEALVRATREAVMNAAKHSGADKIDVYAEADSDLVEVFVRDRGKGFLIEEIGEDRMGVKRSIIERMERHGGKASIRSAPGEGTEIRLEMSK